MPSPTFHPWRPAGAALLIASAALLLGGCAVAVPGAEPPREEAGAASPPSVPEGDSAPGAAGSAKLAVDGREFDVELRLCTVTDDGELLLSGRATETGAGVSGHLDGDASGFPATSHGEFRLDIGADGPFQSSDQFIAWGTAFGGTMSLTEEGDGYVLSAPAWNQDGAELGAGVVRFRCA